MNPSNMDATTISMPSVCEDMEGRFVNPIQELIESRMVLISNLPPDTMLARVVAYIQGGKIVKASLTDIYAPGHSKTAVIMFQTSQVASEFVSFRARHPIGFTDTKGKNWVCDIRLAPGKSYPLPEKCRLGMEGSMTRCIEAEKFPKDQVWDLFSHPALKLHLDTFGNWQRVLDVIYTEGGFLFIDLADVELATCVLKIIKREARYRSDPDLEVIRTSANTTYAPDVCDRSIPTDPEDGVIYDVVFGSSTADDWRLTFRRPCYKVAEEPNGSNQLSFNWRSLPTTFPNNFKNQSTEKTPKQYYLDEWIHLCKAELAQRADRPNPKTFEPWVATDPDTGIKIFVQA
jgi:hypothetical protein